MNSISAQEWLEKDQKKCLLVDVRTPMEFISEHAENAVNVPLDKFTLDKLNSIAGDKEIALICQSGSRAKQAGEKCSNANKTVYLIDGGTSAWVAAGLPKVTGKKSMSLERQVRIAAGILILMGIILSKLCMPGFEYISAFVGAGLIFAGITDTCGMGMMIAKMPWNRVSDCAHSS